MSLSGDSDDDLVSDGLEQHETTQEGTERARIEQPDDPRDEISDTSEDGSDLPRVVMTGDADGNLMSLQTATVLTDSALERMSEAMEMVQTKGRAYAEEQLIQMFD